MLLSSARATGGRPSSDYSIVIIDYVASEPSGEGAVGDCNDDGDNNDCNDNGDDNDCNVADVDWFHEVDCSFC